MTSPVSTRIEDGVAVIIVDNPPVNALSHAVRQGLDEAVRAANDDSAVKAMVIACAGRTFIAGADISEFGKPPQPPHLPDLVDTIEQCQKPVIAGIHGTALGGGLEVALGCHMRAATHKARLGLPEVLLGIIPGAGGTQRLPRLVGVEKALGMITTGTPIKAGEALKAGLIDSLAEDGPPETEADRALQAAMTLARQAIAEGTEIRRTGKFDEVIAKDRGNTALFDGARQLVGKKARGLISPQKAIDAVEAATKLDIAKGIARERELFMECMNSPQREGLIHAFFGERKVAKIPEMKTAKPRPLNKIGIIGGGTMGAGISVAMMQSRLPVTMVERDADAAKAGFNNVNRILSVGVERGKLSEEQKATMLDKLFSVSDDYTTLGDCDLIIEAAFEDMDVKKTIFKTLDEIAKPGAVLASNTSYLDINEIAAVTSRPQDVLGLHFFSPANLMRLLEVVVAEKTAADVAVTGFELAKKTGKVAVRAGVCDGFIGNRILSQYLRCADYMVLDGVSPYDIDTALIEFGYPMGPFAVSDLAGLDIGWATRKRLAKTRDPELRQAEFADRICEQGWFGRKTGKGYYLYDEKQQPTGPNPAVAEFIEADRAAKGTPGLEIPREEIVRRYLAAMINEGARVLEEGIAQRPVDIDMVFLFGYGFPRFRGGPMKYADMVGLDTILADIRTFGAKSDAKFWTPAKLLADLAARGDNFESLNN